MDEFYNLKYNLTVRVESTIVFPVAYIRDEVRIRYTTVNADSLNVLRIEGRLIGQSTFVTLLDVLGSDSQVVDVSTWEEIQVSVITYDTLSDHIFVYASSFDNVPSGNPNIIAKDEGSELVTGITSLNFVGAGVTATNSSGDVTVTIPGGGSGPTYLTATATIDWASIGGDLHIDFPVTVTGALPNDFVVLGLPVGLDGGLVVEAFVSAADTVIIRAHNVIAVAVDEPARTYRVLVIQYP